MNFGALSCSLLLFPSGIILWKNCRSNWIPARIFDRTFHMEILKESLLRTIQDIDATFSKESNTFQF